MTFSIVPRILLFTGEGKGKTTAALGMALRASGHGMHVGIVQFVKGDATVGELAAVTAMADVEIVQAGLGFLPSPADPRMADHRAAAAQGLQQAELMLLISRFPLVILDEICFAVARGLIHEEQVLDLLRKVPPESCVVLTGRDATAGLIAAADTVTEMRAIKHGYHTGIKAQKGVEW